MRRNTAMNDGRRRPPPAAAPRGAAARGAAPRDADVRSTALEEVRRLLGGDSFPECESPSLRLEKFVRIGGNAKKEEIDAVVRCQEKHALPTDPVKPPRAEQFSAVLGGRLIVNQAGGILENAGLCLHPHFGYPYLPGSAVKGIARHAAWCEWKEAVDAGDEEKAEKTARAIAETFGYPTGDPKPKDKRKAEKGRVYLDDYLAKRGWTDKNGKERHTSGTVCFLAAVPAGRAPLVTDIVNCHHPKYYSDGKAKPVATDDESPNPQFFPAVEKEAAFRFTLIPIRGGDVAAAKKWLVDAITLYGAGAKTAAGYGWFDYSEEKNRALAEEEAREKKEKEQREREKERRAAVEKRLKEIEDGLKELDANGGNPLTEESEEAFKRLSKELDSIQAGADRKARMAGLRNRLRSRMPKKNPLDEMKEEWEGKAPEQIIVQSRFISDFGKLGDEEKTAVLALLYPEDARGLPKKEAVKRTHPVWQFLRDDTQIGKDLKKSQQKGARAAAEAIRAFAKEKLERKMP